MRGKIGGEGGAGQVTRAPKTAPVIAQKPVRFARSTGRAKGRSWLKQGWSIRRKLLNSYFSSRSLSFLVRVLHKHAELENGEILIASPDGAISHEQLYIEAQAAFLGEEPKDIKARRQKLIEAIENIGHEQPDEHRRVGREEPARRADARQVAERGQHPQRQQPQEQVRLAAAQGREEERLDEERLAVGEPCAPGLQGREQRDRDDQRGDGQQRRVELVDDERAPPRGDRSSEVGDGRRVHGGVAHALIHQQVRVLRLLLLRGVRHAALIDFGGVHHAAKALGHERRVIHVKGHFVIY